MPGSGQHFRGSRLWRRVAASALVGLTFGSSALLAEIPQVVTDRSRFQIPFDFDAARLAAVGANTVELYVSQDGSRWELAETASPKDRAFVYEASEEGEYEFCVRAKKDDGGRIPDTPLAASLNVVVDRTAPSIGLKIIPATDSDAIVSWAIQDAHVDAASLTLEAQQLDGTWREIDVPKAEQGKTLIATRDTRTIRVRVSDKAGNDAEQVASASLSRAPLVARDSSATANSPASVDAGSNLIAARATANGPVDLSDNEVDAGAAESVTPTSAETATASWNGPVIEPGEPNGDLAAALNLAKPTAAPNLTPASARTAMLPGHGLNGGPGVTNAAYTVAVSKRVNTRTFRLGYELEDVGPSGLSTVALYITEDNGQSWFHYGNDPDANSPMDVTVPRDGIYGFSFRVLSGTGFGDLPPQPGERPEVSIAVDETVPQINMLPLGHQQGTNSHQLAIRWRAFDVTLPPRPIRIEYGPSPAGPWTPVAPPLPNTGEYTWDVSQPMPGAVYLRVTVTDAAGNMASDFTREPIMLDFSRPAARITAIEAITN